MCASFLLTHFARIFKAHGKASANGAVIDVLVDGPVDLFAFLVAYNRHTNVLQLR